MEFGSYLPFSRRQVRFALATTFCSLIRQTSVSPKQKMKTYQKIFAAFLAVCFMTVAAFAADASPAGSWKWTQEGRGGPQDMTAKIEFKDGKVTGTVSGGQAPEPAVIGDGTFKDGMISFTVTREFNGNKRVTKYSGKLEGESIKGSLERETQNGPQKNDWVATRTPAK